MGDSEGDAEENTAFRGYPTLAWCRWLLPRRGAVGWLWWCGAQTHGGRAVAVQGTFRSAVFLRGSLAPKGLLLQRSHWARGGG